MGWGPDQLQGGKINVLTVTRPKWWGPFRLVCAVFDAQINANSPRGGFRNIPGGGGSRTGRGTVVSPCLHWVLHKNTSREVA